MGSIVEGIDPGDVVRLKSGGPAMVVDRVMGVGDHLNLIEARWFVDGILHSATLFQHLLTKRPLGSKIEWENDQQLINPRPASKVA